MKRRFTRKRETNLTAKDYRYMAYGIALLCAFIFGYIALFVWPCDYVLYQPVFEEHGEPSVKFMKCKNHDHD